MAKLPHFSQDFRFGFLAAFHFTLRNQMAAEDGFLETLGVGGWFASE
jgi:hypothetical protein